MKKILDWLREQIGDIYVNDIDVLQDIALEKVDEAEAKWEAECCEWKYCKGNETSYSHHKTSCGKTLHILMDLKDYHYCQYCGKRIKISEVQ